jgi:hypothetical protein
MERHKLFIPLLIFLWLGFISAISFMEAWLKFEAPGITIPLGVGIGQLVFHALNKIEWVLVFFITTLHSLNVQFSVRKHALFFIILIILCTQTFILYPTLDARAAKVMAGEQIPLSLHHWLFIFLEIMKAMCLFTYGLKVQIMNARNPFPKY